jgi:hypothetical protein
MGQTAVKVYITDSSDTLCLSGNKVDGYVLMNGSPDLVFDIYADIVMKSIADSHPYKVTPLKEDVVLHHRAVRCDLASHLCKIVPNVDDPKSTPYGNLVIEDVEVELSSTPSVTFRGILE